MLLIIIIRCIDFSIGLLICKKIIYTFYVKLKYRGKTLENIKKCLKFKKETAKNKNFT